MKTETLMGAHPLLSDRNRLVILATVAATDNQIDFNTLKESLNLSKGNLSSHIRKLEEAGLIAVEKKFVGKMPRTTYTCTKEGKKEVKNYLSGVESLLGKL